VREDAAGRHLLFQTWDWHGEHYDFALYIVHDRERTCATDVYRGTYYAVSIANVARLMKDAEFEDVRRLDDVLFQPVVIGRRR
jgi:uncharacterized protein YcbK (DUF882 family)